MAVSRVKFRFFRSLGIFLEHFFLAQPYRYKNALWKYSWEREERILVRILGKDLLFSIMELPACQKDTRTMCQICSNSTLKPLEQCLKFVQSQQAISTSNSTIKTAERCLWHYSVEIIVIFKKVPCPSVLIAPFLMTKVNAKHMYKTTFLV